MERHVVMKKIGVIAGSGTLVELVIDGCCRKDIPFHIIALKNQCDFTNVGQYSHTWVSLGQVGSIIKELKAQQCTHIVMAGRVQRPQNWRNLKLDLKGTLLISKFIGKSLGDDGLVRIIIDFLEQEGFKVIGCEDVILKTSLCDVGVMTKKLPDESHHVDIHYGLNILKCLSPVDVGQSCIIYNSLVLGIEAIEGTDQLIQRCQSLRDDDTGGVLIKALKVGQDDRVDRPAIGEQTIVNLAQGGFLGLAVQAGGVIFLNKDQVIDKANQLGMFIIGVDFDVTHKSMGQ